MCCAGDGKGTSPTVLKFKGNINIGKIKMRSRNIVKKNNEDVLALST